MSDEPTTAKPSRITVDFVALGMAECTVRVEQCTPAQIAAAAWTLEQMACDYRREQTARMASAGLAIPGLDSVLRASGLPPKG